MKLIYCILLFFFVSYIEAQEIENVQLRVHYATKFKRWENSKNMSSDEQVLDIGKNVSKFYSLWETRNEEIRDSILARGGTYQEVQNVLGKAGYPRSYEYYAVYKNYPEKGRITYTDKEFKDYMYQEELEKPQWQIFTEEKALVADYQCQKAQTDFRGRTWTVWFTMDIPIGDGPWKLCALPGLILKAEDSRGDFLFKCIEIKYMDRENISIPKHKYLKCDRETLKRLIIKSAQDPVGYLRQLGYESGGGMDANGRPLKYDEKMPVLLEYESFSL